MARGDDWGELKAATRDKRETALVDKVAHHKLVRCRLASWFGVKACGRNHRREERQGANEGDNSFHGYDLGMNGVLQGLRL